MRLAPVCRVFLAVLFLGAARTSFGFALLGPYADWMQRTNGYRWAGDTGAAMDLHEGYRWNVPVVTYAFDKSFLDYFGSNGVAAVEAAVQVINDLPAASSLVLSNFPVETRRHNFGAEQQWLVDLKSAALAMMVEQMGLAPPTRSIFNLRRYDPIFVWQPDEASWPPGTIPSLVLERNFDPESLAPSHLVNSFLYSGQVEPNCISCPEEPWDVIEFRLDPGVPLISSVGDARGSQLWYPGLPLGVFFQGLTQDDVGGLRYLLSTNNVNFEILLGDVHGTGTNATNYVNGALRPGVNKITFVRQQYDSETGQAVAITNRFTDVYVTNNVRVSQQLERVVAFPDILFTTEDLATIVSVQARNITGTSNWWNGAALAGNPGGAGPGIIRPPAKIGFDRFTPLVLTSDNGIPSGWGLRWGSFDNTTNGLIGFPQGSTFEGADRLNIHLWLADYPPFRRANYFNWQVPVPLGGEAIAQTSTNLLDWNSEVVITNFAGSVIWDHLKSLPRGFLRIVPK